jgi:tRNA threonylcarbamoyladenosine biosynthesis protein TsaB
MELSIDTASEIASIALSLEGWVEAERTWRCERNHTVELLPAIDRLLNEAGVDRGELSAVFVSLGPGMYTGLRVGVSVAQGIARGLGIPALGVGRLELDAYPHTGHDGRIVTVHRAGRGELAWAVYEGRGKEQGARSQEWREVSAPRLSKAEELIQEIAEGALVTGEVDDALAAMLAGRATVGEAREGRARALAVLGYARLRAGETAEPALLRPVYLRPPAIGPQGG